MKITFEGTPKEVKELLQAVSRSEEQAVKLDSIDYNDLNCSGFPKEIPSMLEILKANSGI